MSKVTIKAKNQTQLQEWVDKLKIAGKPYDFKSSLELSLEQSDSIEVLGLKGKSELKWYHYALGIAALILFLWSAPTWCSRTLKSVPEATKIEKINAQFIPGTNENLKLARYIKKNMHNPKSYDHIQTEWGITQDTLIEITTTIRGENKLGGRSIQKAKALLDANGNVLEFHWLE